MEDKDLEETGEYYFDELDYPFDYLNEIYEMEQKRIDDSLDNKSEDNIKGIKGIKKEKT